MKQKLIEILKLLKLFPTSGFGSVKINFFQGGISNIELSESIKLDDK